MRSVPGWLVCVIAAVVIAGDVDAQTHRFDDPFPLTNTRYGEAAGVPLLIASDDADFLFWRTEEGVRVTKIVDGERRGGRVVLETLGGSGTSFDVVRTGAYFFVAAATPIGDTYGIVGQLVDANGEPVGGKVTLSQDGNSLRLAATASSMLLVYIQPNRGLRARLLSPTGQLATVDAPFLYTRWGGPFDVESNGNTFAVVAAFDHALDVTMLDAAGAITATATYPSPTHFTGIALASDGRDFLVATSVYKQAVTARFLRADGSMHGNLVLDGGVEFLSSAIWNGSEYLVAYGLVPDLRIVRIDPTVQWDFGREAIPWQGSKRMSITTRAGRTRVAFGVSPIMLTELPVAEHEPVVASFAALNQKLLASASANHATLIVWSDDALRVGIRTEDGRWRERALRDADPDYGVAESDGRGFLVFAKSGKDVVAIPLDSEGSPLPQRTTMPFTPTDVLWTGSAYAAVGIGPQGVMVSSLTSSGVVSEPVVVEPHDRNSLSTDQAVIATNGDGFLVAWHRTYFNAPYDALESIQAVTLDASFGTIQPIYELEASGRNPAVDWRYQQYSLVFTAWRSVYSQHVNQGPLEEAHPIYSGWAEQEYVSTRTHRGYVFYSWLDWLDPVSAAPAHRILVDGRITTFRDGARGAPLVVPLPNGSVAYVAACVQRTAPHHGSTHLVMAVADYAAKRPSAPRAVTARVEGTRIRIQWSPATDASGYRVEYRIEDGSWNELDRWFDAEDRSTTFEPVRAGVTYAFRVRAWGTGGTGPYSLPVATQAGRRRAVR